MGWGRLLAAVLLVVAADDLVADTLTTTDGRTYEGPIELVAEGLRVSTPEGGVLVPLAELQQAALDGEGGANATRPWRVGGIGVLCVNGSFIAKRPASIDGPRVRFEPPLEGLQLTTTNTAGVFFRSPGPWEARTLRFERGGVLLRDGDFMAGRLLSLEGDELRTESVLLGPRSFRIDGEVAALVLRAPLPEEDALELSLADGSVLRASEWEWRDGHLVLNGSPFESYRVPATEIRGLRRGSARSFLDLLEERWKLEGQSDGLDPAPFTKDPRLANLGRALAMAHAVEKTRVAELEDARRTWQASQQQWNRRNQEAARVRSDTNRARAQVRSKAQQVVSVKRSEQQVRRELDEKRRGQDKAVRELNEARKALAAAKKDDAARRRAEADLRNATKNRQNADRAVSQAQSRHKGTVERVKTAENAQRATEGEVRKAEERERSAREAAEEAKRESDAAKRRLDAVVRDLERAAAGVREAAARLEQARKALGPQR